MAVPHPAEKHLIRIEVHMDTLCPWCFIQKRSLDAAIQRFQAKYPNVEFEVLYRPFYLYPLLDYNCDKAALYEEDAKNHFHTNIEKIRAAGARYDIKFRFTGITGPSRDSHKLITFALEQRSDPAVQNRVVEDLLIGHFEEGRDLTDHDWLVAVGQAAGLSPKTIRRVLESDDAGASIDAEVRSATVERDVRAVPCVTMQGRYRMGGFQEEHVIREQFQRIVDNGGN